MADKPVHQVKRPQISIAVYPKKIEIKDNRGLFGFLSPKTKTIPISRVTSVEAEPMRETLTIETMGGDKVKLALGGVGGTAKKLRDAILEQM